MKEFIDYFWWDKGFSYDPTKGYLFNTYHIIMLASMVLLFILLWIIGKRIKNKRIFITILSITLLVLEVLRVLNFKYAHNNTLLGAMSFHLCSIGVYLAILAGFIKRPWIIDALSIHALIGAPLAIIVPDGILPWFNEYSFMPIQSFITHTLLFFVPIYMIRVGFFKIKLKNFYIPIISILLSALLGYIMSMVNYKLSNGGFSNFFWTRYKDPSFDKIISIDYPYQFIVIISMLLITGLFIYFVGDRLTKNKTID